MRNDNSLITPICILLPSIQFIIHTERYTFFEASLGVSGPAGYQESSETRIKTAKEWENGPDDVTFQDKTQCHIKILGNVRFRPDLFLPISWINEDGVLDRFPSQETTRLSVTMSVKIRCKLNNIQNEMHARIVAHERSDFAISAGYKI